MLTKMYTKVSSVNFHMSYFHMFCFLARKRSQKNPRAHKNKIGTSPPPPKPKYPPPKRGILWTWFFLQNGRIFPGVHKIGAAISGPRIADKNFTDTKRIFLKGQKSNGGLETQGLQSECPRSVRVARLQNEIAPENRKEPEGKRKSGVTRANQTKERPVHELFPGAFRNKSSM